MYNSATCSTYCMVGLHTLLRVAYYIPMKKKLSRTDMSSWVT